MCFDTVYNFRITLSYLYSNVKELGFVVSVLLPVFLNIFFNTDIAVMVDWTLKLNCLFQYPVSFTVFLIKIFLCRFFFCPVYM